MVKALFIFPPPWTTYSISTGIPQIMGFLEKNGYSNIEALDLNIKFFQYFYKKDKLQKIWESLKEKRISLYKQIKANDGSDNYQQKLNKRKFVALHEYISRKDKEKVINNKINQIEDIIKKYKSGNVPKQRSEFKFAKETFAVVNDLIRFDLFEELFSVADKYFEYIENSEYKQYEEFFSVISDEIIKQNYDYIGFSVNSSGQAIAALILTKILREKGIKSHICYGGSETHFLKSVVLKNKKYFDDYIDTLMLGAGEHPTLELFEYLEGNRNIKDVTNIIYKNEKGEIKENKVKQILEKNFVFSSYKGYNFNEYTLPESVIPIRTSFGCYWGKCTFCNYNSITKYEQRSVNSVISEIKYYIKNYKVNNFYFVDAALSPKFLREFSKKIKQENLEIYYFSNLRFEKDYTKEFLAQLYETGLRVCGWGLESASPRILKLMRKGTKIENSKTILKNAHEIGLINHLYYIVGFPTETEEDFNITCDFIINNIDCINSIAHHFFSLYKGSYIFSHPKEFGIKPEEILTKTVFSNLDIKYCHIRINELYNKIMENYNAFFYVEDFLIHSKIKK